MASKRVPFCIGLKLPACFIFSGLRRFMLVGVYRPENRESGILAAFIFLCEVGAIICIFPRQASSDLR